MTRALVRRLLWSLALLLTAQARAQYLQLPIAAQPLPFYELPELGAGEEGQEDEDEIETDRDSFTPATTEASAAGQLPR